MTFLRMKPELRGIGAKLDRAVVTTPRQRGKVNPLWGLEGTPAWQAIEDLQPYHRGGDQELLGALHLELARNADAGEVLRTVLMVGTPLEDGTDVVRVHLAPTGPNPQVVLSFCPK
jgi:hypothetical protein